MLDIIFIVLRPLKEMENSDMEWKFWQSNENFQLDFEHLEDFIDDADDDGEQAGLQEDYLPAQAQQTKRLPRRGPGRPAKVEVIFCKVKFNSIHNRKFKRTTPHSLFYQRLKYQRCYYIVNEKVN